MTQTIRVLIIEDSALMRKKTREMIDSVPDCEVIATARDGEDALAIVQVLKPDVIVLDLQLPKMDGLTCLMYIMSEWPTPVVILSAFAQEGNENAIKALEYGAIEIVSKPNGAISLNIDIVKEELIAKIRIAAKSSLKHMPLINLNKSTLTPRLSTSHVNKLLTIGSSTGGPAALSYLFSQLPGTLDVGIIVIQHMPHYLTKPFAQRLNRLSELYIKEAENEEPIVAGQVLVAPTGFEMRVVKNNQNIECVQLITEKTKLHHLSPSIDKTFESIAMLYGKNSIGLLLTGMGKDGTEGCRKIKSVGGLTIAEDESTCVVYGMPAYAISQGVIDKVAPLNEMSTLLIHKFKSITHG